VTTVAELLDQGVKAYTRGQAEEAERCWRECLELEPENERARAYLRQLRGDSAPRPEVRAASAGSFAAKPARSAPPASRPAEKGRAPAPPRAEPKPVAPAAVRGPGPQAAGAQGPGYAKSPWDDGPALAATIVLDPGPGSGLELDIVAEKSDLKPLVPERRPGPAAAKSDVDVWMEGARELFALGDFSGSLEMIEKILRVDPDHAEARAYLRQNEATLIAMYESKLGPLTNVPRIAISGEEVMWLNLDHRAGFLLAQVDGIVSYEELFSLSGLPRLDTARILATLLAEGVIR